jgi:hypothetical protein
LIHPDVNFSQHIGFKKQIDTNEKIIVVANSAIIDESCKIVVLKTDNSMVVFVDELFE